MYRSKVKVTVTVTVIVTVTVTVSIPASTWFLLSLTPMRDRSVFFTAHDQKLELSRLLSRDLNIYIYIFFNFTFLPARSFTCVSVCLFVCLSVNVQFSILSVIERYASVLGSIFDGSKNIFTCYLLNVLLELKIFWFFIYIDLFFDCLIGFLCWVIEVGCYIITQFVRKGKATTNDQIFHFLLQNDHNDILFICYQKTYCLFLFYTYCGNIL